jgi:hypothetical protein
MQTAKQRRLQAIANGELYGIDKLLLLVDFFVILSLELISDLKDKKMRIGEVIGLIDNVKELPKLYVYRKEIAAQIGNLSTDEGQILINHIEEKFKLNKEKATKIAHYALQTLANMVGLVGAIKLPETTEKTDEFAEEFAEVETEVLPEKTEGVLTEKNPTEPVNDNII